MYVHVANVPMINKFLPAVWIMHWHVFLDVILFTLTDLYVLILAFDNKNAVRQSLKFAVKLTLAGRPEVFLNLVLSVSFMN